MDLLYCNPLLKVQSVNTLQLSRNCNYTHSRNYVKLSLFAYFIMYMSKCV